MSDPASAPERLSVYQRALGAQFDLLDPGLRRYFSAPPRGMVGVGRGVYEVAGSRRRILRPLLVWLAWRHILFPEFGRDIEFTVTNEMDAAGALSARRTFGFPTRERVMEDTMSVECGRLIDRLGRRRGLEAGLDVSVVDGHLRMTSNRFHLRLARLRIPLPRVAIMTLDERTHATDPGVQVVDVRIVSPLLGEVFRYTGSFSYDYEPMGTITSP